MPGKCESFPQAGKERRRGCSHLYARTFATEGKSPQRGYQTADELGRKHPEPVSAGNMKPAADDEFRLRNAAAGNERIVFDQPAQKTGGGNKNGKPERRNPPVLPPAGKPGEDDGCGMIAGKAETAYDAGAAQSYDDAFQSEQNAVRPDGPVLMKMQIHEISCMTRRPRKGRNVNEACKGRRARALADAANKNGSSSVVLTVFYLFSEQVPQQCGAALQEGFFLPCFCGKLQCMSGGLGKRRRQKKENIFGCRAGEF